MQTMSVTIKDCLKLPSLNLGQVVAGHAGLDQIVTTISVLEFNDSDEEDLINPNELLISSLHCVKDDPDAQCRLVEKSKRSGDVGLIIFYSDVVLKTISPQLIRLADMLQFPLIVMPGEDMGLKYSDVISDVMEAIYMDQKLHRHFVHDTIARLSQMPEIHRTPARVLSLASNYARASFFLCDKQHNLIAEAFWPTANILDFTAVYEAYEKPDFVSFAGKMYRIARQDFQDKAGTNLILYAATANNRLNSTILSEVIEVVQLFCMLWNYNLNLRTPDAVIPALLKGETELLDYICASNHIRLSAFDRILLFETGVADAESKVDSGGTDSNTIPIASLQAVLSENGYFHIMNRLSNCLVILCGLENKDQALSDSLFYENLRIVMRESAPALTCTTFLSENLRDNAVGFYTKYCATIETARTIYPRRQIFRSNDIHFSERVQQFILSFEASDRYFSDLLHPIIHDQEEGLMLTLSTYLLDTNSEVKKTAELLYIHRNTVLYRLNKIRELLHCDLNEMPMAYDIYFATAIYRVQQKIDRKS